MIKVVTFAEWSALDNLGRPAIIVWHISIVTTEDAITHHAVDTPSGLMMVRTEWTAVECDVRYGRLRVYLGLRLTSIKHGATVIRVRWPAPESAIIFRCCWTRVGS